MKSLPAFALFLAVLLAGCGGNSGTPAQQTNAPASGGGVLTAPVDYLGAVGNAQKSAVKTIDTASIQQAIQMFQIDKGRFPKELKELVDEGFMPRIPEAPYGMKIVYNAQDGSVKVVKQ